MKYTLDYLEYTKTARQAIAEGQVLLKNDNDVLPINNGAVVSVFGRMQNHYYKSGTGSGGMVNVKKVYGILDALYEAQNDTGVIKVYEPLAKIYSDWEIENPYIDGKGWGAELWSQPEMPLTEAVVKDAAANSDAALVIIARSSGEDQDNKNEKGSFLLTDLEIDMLKKVRASFSKMAVILNVGNIINMKAINEVSPDAILYAWQGGMLGGLGTVDVITGAVNPSGHLSDTIAADIEDYPSNANFGDPNEAIYAEDIFVGYRYFETFAKEKVLYPFGYGLSYTQFNIDTDSILLATDYVSVDVTVTNVGLTKGREVVQVYVKAPNGALGKPARVLAGFKKTNTLQMGESVKLNIALPFRNFASFDETNKVGVGIGFVLEKGSYEIYIGENVRDAKVAGHIDILEDTMIEELENAMGPVKAFDRMTASSDSEGGVLLKYEKAPLRTDTQAQRRANRLPKSISLSDDKGYKLIDVKNKKVSMDDFIAQLSKEELCMIIRNEGMCSPLVTPGTAAAFGGIYPTIKDKGIPIGCMDDGPSGMRLDSGMRAFSLPNGTLLACTFDPELNEKLFGFLGIEMLKNKVDVLLGPGMNIHRHPLNGRNFEYFSEDPILTGTIGSAQIKGLQSARVTGTIKHFACNNQEIGRQQVDPVVSERALREIYLRGFEMAVKAGADAVMTTYCQINGVWTAGCYDLNTTILRDQWGFKGIVMTDWWANISEEGVTNSKNNFAGMVRAQNDLYACTPSATADVGDNALASLEDGTLTLGEIQRCAKNICEFLIKYAVFDRSIGEDIQVEVIGKEEDDTDMPDNMEYIFVGKHGVVDLSNVEVKMGEDYYFGVEIEEAGVYDIKITGRGIDDNELAQIPVVLFVGPNPDVSFMYRGTKEWNTQTGTINLLNQRNVLHLHFGLNGVELKDLEFTCIKKWSWSD